MLLLLHSFILALRVHALQQLTMKVTMPDVPDLDLFTKFWDPPIPLEERSSTFQVEAISENYDYRTGASSAGRQA